MARRSGAGGQPVPPLRDSAGRAADSLERPHPRGRGPRAREGRSLRRGRWPGLYKLLPPTPLSSSQKKKNLSLNFEPEHEGKGHTAPTLCLALLGAGRPG